MNDTRVDGALEVTEEPVQVEFPGDSGFAALPYESSSVTPTIPVTTPPVPPSMPSTSAGAALLSGVAEGRQPNAAAPPRTPFSATGVAPAPTAISPLPLIEFDGMSPFNSGEALPITPADEPPVVAKVEVSHRDVTTPGGGARHLFNVIAPCLTVMGLAALFRIAFPSTYDVFQDEVNYVDLSTSIRQGHYPPHFLNQGVFLLHPPLLFLMGAGWQKLLHPGGDYFHLVDSMRLLTALFAVATAALIFGLANRVAGRRYAFVAGVLFAVEPYALRTNGRVLLETTALTFVLAGYFLLLGMTRDRRRQAKVHARSGLRRPLVALSAGVLMGFGVATLELTAIITIGPLLVLLWRRWCLERRYVLLMLVGTLLPYGAYMISLVATHHIHAFYIQDSDGLKRILGLERTTGFNAAGSPSLIHTLLSQAGSFGTTYVLAGLGVIAGIYPLLRGNDDLKFIGTVVLCGAVTILYEGLFGTIEEQFLYVLLIPALVAIAAATSDLLRKRRNPRKRRRLFGVAVTAVCAALVLYDVGVWAYTRSRPDNGLTRTVSFLKKNVPASDLVATNVLVATYVLEHSGIPAVTVTTPAAAARAHVHYLTVLSAELQGHYGSITVQQARWFASHGRVIYSFNEATYGKILVYESTNPAAW